MQDQDWQLLREYVEHDSQVAFGSLVARYLNFVYATCFREVGDSALAEDVTQVVFLLFARKAASLKSEVVLSGWLFQTARFAAKNARRREERWHHRMQQAMEVIRDEEEAKAASSETTWAQLEPLVHEGLVMLNEVERNAVLLRCFEGRTLKETGEALGLSEEAARKRVTRGLEKLRGYFTRRGVTLSVTALAALLTAHAVKASPLNCASVAQAVLLAPALSSLSGSLTSQGTLGGTSGKALAKQSRRFLPLGKGAVSAIALCAIIAAVIGSRTWWHQPLRAPPTKTAPIPNASRQLGRSVTALADIPRATAQVLPRSTAFQTRASHSGNVRADNPKETEKMKKASTFVMALSAASLLSVSALADDINARIKSVDPGAHTITVIERKEDHTFTITDSTRFVNAQGDVLATGLKKGKYDTLEIGVKSGVLKEGTRLAITFQKKGNQFLASLVQLRDKNRETHK